MEELTRNDARPERGAKKTRVPTTLACDECRARNYKTTKAPGSEVELRKFCKACKKHTLHKETK